MTLNDAFDRRLALVVCLTMGCSVISGCSKSRRLPGVETLPVSGKITLDGKPLPGADVMFTTAEGASFGGTTNEDGIYELVGVPGKGICIGACQVVVSRYLKPDGSPLEPDEAPAMVQAIESLPDIYSLPGKSDLSAEVPEGGGTFDFDLASK